MAIDPKTDDAAELSALPLWLGRVAFAALLLMAAAAPHSIAASQGFWLIGITALAGRMITGPGPRFRLTYVDWALLAFVGWSVLSAALSYEPAISLDKLRSVSLFLVFYLARGAIASPRAARTVIYVLIVSCMVNVIWTPLERMIGRGVELHGIRPDGPLGRNGMLDGDTILRVNGTKVNSPEDVIAEIERELRSQVVYHRPDADHAFTIPVADIGTGSTPLERLGAASWQPNRVWRAKGFYGHFTTYSEVLQLIASLVLGLGLAGAVVWYRTRREKGHAGVSPMLRLTVLAGVFVMFCIALLLSGTRASQLGLFVSGVVMVGALGSRKLLVIALLAAIPAAAIGFAVLQQTRQQGETNEYRVTMWRDGVRLATESPRHLLVGVGQDSIRARWEKWGLFDGGRLPMGHFHSTPIQLAVERGLPALGLWLAFLTLGAAMLWRAVRRMAPDRFVSRGIIVGCLGALFGFFTSGLVHYNLGDSEVALVFYLLMGIGVVLAQGEERDVVNA
jgi:hypothetical protein